MPSLFFKKLSQIKLETLCLKKVIKKALDTVINTFNSSNKIHREYFQKQFGYGIQNALKSGILTSDYKIKLITFIKDCCEDVPGRLVANVQSMALNKEEIMKVRWHACDTLKELEPEEYEKYMGIICSK